ncbi:MAG TPA: hypothetical protein VMW77_06180 [Methanoregula sp.]|nr:hypothetical protein [Methanoregula sp.]
MKSGKQEQGTKNFILLPVSRLQVRYDPEQGCTRCTAHYLLN